MSLRARLQLDERKQQLIKLGLELFSQRSYDEISIDEIAKKAGISKGLLYHYFPGKRPFYVAAIRAATEQLQEAIEPNESLPPPMRVFAGLDAYLQFVEARAGAYMALLRSGIGVDPEVAQIVDQTRKTIVDRILSGIGVNNSAVYRNVARGWIGAVEAASIDWLEHRDLDRSMLTQLLLKQLVGALLVARQSEPDIVLNLPVDLDAMASLISAAKV